MHSLSLASALVRMNLASPCIHSVRPSYPTQSLTFIKSINPKSEPLNIVECVYCIYLHPTQTSAINAQSESGQEQDFLRVL
ncbi:hypothetical protein M404DRAFT_993296 [Pisolithus tinctorius Marx 270]|uniref:Uncharacterized protein n=1 Tax=Pisolithus tinctorius Marx 270 TaxID=870435 RepID=A0A0C3PI56_PISTI|nr:hypothetical protein M404DRAFT_993296 [Pisolithus tinctorius Marx 270]